MILLRLLRAAVVVCLGACHTVDPRIKLTKMVKHGNRIGAHNAEIGMAMYNGANVEVRSGMEKIAKTTSGGQVNMVCRILRCRSASGASLICPYLCPLLGRGRLDDASSLRWEA